ncbi:MAG: ISNCY family transposase, partial [bacterium]|nr:ISNCY family transposase [bacterium]
IEKRLTQREAARMLGLTSRQGRRLRRAYEQDGARALASKHRGRPSNRRLPSELRREALATVRSQYEGFGPTLAHEKLTELHDLRLSVETLRHWMVEDGLWVPRASREPRIQQPRRRRPCRGELIQIDGCDHEWFEERAGRCTLLVFVDDATSALMELLFCESESAFSYFAAMRSYLEQHGKPVTLYSDKATVFRVNKKEPQGGTGVTQFSRALGSLNIDILCANTPAAKGRVERAHLTLQDRLVKELRLRGISDVQAANAFAPEYIADYNRRFARAPRSAHDAHRPLQPSDNLARVFTWQETRLVSKSLTLNYKRVLYVLDPTEAARAARGKRVGIEEREDGSLCFWHGAHALLATAFPKEHGVQQGEVVENKRLSEVMDLVRERQRERTEAKIAKSSTTTLRKARLLRAGAHRRTTTGPSEEAQP